MKKHDYSEYSDKEMKERIEEIEDILSKNFDELGRNLGIDLSEETRISIKNVIGKTNQLLDYNWDNTIRLLERSYQKLPKKSLTPAQIPFSNLKCVFESSNLFRQHSTTFLYPI